jgi:2-oxoglutarate ferredoxin oxidoreductase subunit alpha
MGVFVGGKNVFPSNIAGLPTWFWIRANANGYSARCRQTDIMVAMNSQTLLADQVSVKSDGFFLYNSDLKVDFSNLNRTDITYVPIPFNLLLGEISGLASDMLKLKKLLINIVYLGILARLLKIERNIVETCIQEQFGNKESVVRPNLLGFQAGYLWAENNLEKTHLPFSVQKRELKDKYVLMDGNTASALGSVFGGCSFSSWYPITPSSSLIEKFESFCGQMRVDDGGRKKFAVVQAEDELSAICMILGAGWAGARAMTASSGPGISLMSEAAGYAYYAEIPCVVWNVQRVGPSTGMPTRTAQGDILATLNLSHGDTKHPLLFPANIQECFEFAQTAFDLAERLQQLVFVMSDLDLGMNLWMEKAWPYPEKPYDRGKVLTAQDLASMPEFFRYVETDGDAIAPRTLPGTAATNAAYFTRGSGHNKKGFYTENPNEYQEVVDRLARKWDVARSLVPSPIVDVRGSDIGIIAFGTTDTPMNEARDFLASKGFLTDYLRIRALPFCESVRTFLESHRIVFVVEQNRDGQMKQVIASEYPKLAHKLISVLHYDGTPIVADDVFEPILKNINNQTASAAI